MKRVRNLLKWFILADLVFTVGFWGIARLADQTAKIDGGTGIVFYSDSGSDTARRVETAVDLLTADKLDRLIMVGGHRPQDGVVGSQQMALIAARLSGQSERISADVESRDTASGITNAERFVDDNKKIVFVSNCMHIMRAKRIFYSTHDTAHKVLGACSRSSYNPLNTWRRVHYELGAWALFVMPESLSDRITDRLRGDAA